MTDLAADKARATYVTLEEPLEFAQITSGGGLGFLSLDDRMVNREEAVSCSRVQLSSRDAEYIAHVANRIVTMFQRYSQNLNPRDQRFLAFIYHCVEENNLSAREGMRYSELYEGIKEGIREYLTNQQPVQSQRERKKDDKH